MNPQLNSFKSLAIQQEAMQYNTLIYGEPKTKKTTIALSTAEHKPVLLFDCDGGSAITFTNPALSQFKDNIFRINLCGGYVALMFMRRLFSGKPFYWNNTTQKMSPRPEAGFIEINLSYLTNWVLVFDSFTQYCSLLYQKYYEETGQEPNAEVVGKDKGDLREFYWTGQVANDFIAKWNSIQADKILITHTVPVEVNEGASKRVQFYPASNTRNQSVAMGRSFNNVIACYKDMGKCFATTAPDKFYQSGSSTSIPKKYSVDTLIDKELVKSMVSPIIENSQPTQQSKPILEIK